MDHALRFLASALVLVLVSGCAGKLQVRPEIIALPRSYSPGDIIDTHTGNKVTSEEMLDELAKARIVYAGEMHTSQEDHRLQLKILQGLYARNPSIVIGMEMFPREVQPVLNKYWQGTIPEDEFLKEVGWEDIWGYPFQFYRGLLTYAEEHKLRVIGLNAPREVVSKIGRGGLASLSPEDRARVAQEFHLQDARHREHVRQTYSEHMKGDIQSFETFFEAQLAWEETMSETLARELTVLGERGLILVIVGKGHISGRTGIPELTWMRLNHVCRTVATVPLDYPGSAADPDIADYVVVTDVQEPIQMPQHRGKLGVSIRVLDSGAGVEINSVIPGSPAEKAGLRKGDVIKSIDGIQVKTLEDIHKALAGKRAEHTFVVQRGGTRVSIGVTIQK